MRATLAERFWSNVAIRGSDDCWEWLAAKTHGYGSMRVDGKNRCATHILFYLRHGYWPPKGRTANHHCDNPGCLNPRHLYLGTWKSNMRDKVKRGRESHLNGAQNGKAKLTYVQICEIKRLTDEGYTTQAELGRKFGVGQQHISAIKTGKTWK